MSFNTRAFSTQMKLPCTIVCESDPGRKFSGTALKIEPESMVLRLRASQMFPRVGEKVDLEVHLPVNEEVAGAKDLSIRGMVTAVTETSDGARQLVLVFRKAQFKDRAVKRVPDRLAM